MAMGYSRSALLFVAMGTLVAFSSRVSAAPNFKVDPTRIYTPDEIDNLRQAIALQKCQRDPSCNPNVFFGISDGRCSIGAGVDGMLKEMVEVRTTGRCNPFTGEVVWPATGQCVQLLTQGPCPHGYWVKLRLTDLEPLCDKRPCEDGQGLMDGGRCLSMDDQSMCPSGESLLNNEFGTAECDCAPGMTYHSLTQACYTPYTQGPCPPGQIIKVLDVQGGGKAECMPNLCPEENMVMIDSQCQVQDGSSAGNPSGSCYHINTPGPCDSGILSIDNVLLEPVCLLQTETHTIFNLPNIRGCRRGSRRDTLGRCRRDVSKSFGKLPPLVTSKPGAGGGTICPKGQVLLGGICYRLALNSNRDTPTP